MKRFFALCIFSLPFFLVGCSSSPTGNKDQATDVQVVPVATVTAVYAVFPPVASSTKYSLDTSVSTFGWTGKKMLGQHTGKISFEKGEVFIEQGSLRGGNFVVLINTLVDEDLTDPAQKSQLETHLKSADFFDGERYPAATLSLVGADPILDASGDDPNYLIRANLAIKDVTNGVLFPAYIYSEGVFIKAKANFAVDRTKWNIRYGSGKFFEGLGDKVIADPFTVKLDLVLVKDY
ncbi:MAG: YceI family protein [bacterium]